MKIAHVCPFSPPRVIGGVARVVWELSKRQVKAGHNVSIITSDFDKTKRINIKKETVDGIDIYYCYHYLKVGDFSTIWPSVYKKLLALKPDLIHCHIPGHLHSYLSKKAAKKLGIPYIVTTHCPWESNRSVPATVANWVSFNLFPTLRHADAIIAITSWEHQFLLAEGVKQENIYTIPNGMDKMFFEKIIPNKFKEKHNIPINHKIILFFARLNYTKNPLMFLDIAESILEKRGGITFCMLGPDEGQLKFVEERINNFSDDIKKNFRLLPPDKNRKNIVEMYQSSDIYVLPSMREGNPLTLYEAYASGLPVIASNVNGVPDGLQDNVNGFLLERHDLKGFIEKVNFLLDNEDVRNEFIVNNLEKAKEYDWDIIERKTMDVYEKK